MSWFASWLPSIPTINLSIPTSIQGRFVSFFLKKFLGHFFKQGQLDTPQIDSQIGSGYVQINDLDFDPLTINSYLVGLPIVVEEGVVKAVTARIPWPNPLTSTIGLSLNGLHLKLRLQAPIQEDFVGHEADLADSVVSVAESFVQQELSDPAEAKVWESFHAAAAPITRPTASRTTDDDHMVPGGLNASPSSSEVGYGGSEAEFDPAGVSMFATLFERLLARFRFDAKDIHITLVDPNNVTFKFTLAEIKYSTSEQPEEGAQPSIRRTLTVHGIKLATVGHIPTTDSLAGSTSTTRPLPIGRAREGTSRDTTPTSSPTSSSSSMDEDAQFLMSQSLAGLPPRAQQSAADSMVSSVYHSIISERPSLEAESQFASPPTLHASVVEQSPKEHVLLSFGSSPLEVHLNTPSPSPHNPNDTLSSAKDRYRLTVACGSIAIALQPWQVACIAQAAETASSQQHSPESTGKSTSGLSGLGIDGEVHVRCLSVLLMGSQPLETTLGEKVEYYFDHPLSPPQLDVGYTRLLLDTISATASLVEGGASTLTIKDISAFHFTNPRSTGSQVDIPIAIPILITDPYLPMQYNTTHAYPSRSDPFTTSIPQPTFPVMDWFDKKCLTYGAKLSQWRTRRYDRHGRTSSKGTSEPAEGISEPALCTRLDSASSRTTKKKSEKRGALDVQIAPLHLFVDIEMVQEEGGLMRFAEEMAMESETRRLRTMPTQRDYLSDEDELSSVDEDPPSPIIQPKDANTAKTSPADLLSWSVDIPAIRISVRVPPPPGRSKRSGILVLDVHKINAVNRPPSSERQLRFANAPATPSIRDSLYVVSDPPSAQDTLARVQCRRIVVGISNVLEEQLTAVLSVGPLQASSDQDTPLSPQVTISRREVNCGQLAVNVDVPSVYLSLSKGQLDSLQYWMDDLGQAMERMNALSGNRSSGPGSKDSSLIGSRYFAKSRSGSALNSRRAVEEGVQTCLSLNVTELFCRVHLPRSDIEPVTVRPFDVAGGDLSAVVKVHGGGKLEAIVNMMDVFVQDTGESETLRTFLALTAARSLMAAPVPLVKLKFVSSTIPETIAKETRLSVSLNGFTFNFYPDLGWLQDLMQFTKSPPGTFEAVVPSERTVISLKIGDGSVRLLAPKHKGSVVLAIGGMNFATDLVGTFPDTSFRVDVPAMSVMAIEDVGDERQSRRVGEGAKDSLHWKSLGYATLADLSGLKLKYQENASGSPQKQVIVEGACLKIHACADTFGAVGAFIGDLSSAFSSPEIDPDEDLKKRQAKEPAVISRAKDEGDILTGSIDESAFRKPPEIGPAPDMIYDDLPTNLDYLDESFGAAAGLRELTDDDFDDFDTTEIDARNVAVTDASTGIISSVGGETIKLLDEDGINIIEDYYDTLPREVVEDRPDVSNESLRVRVHGCDVHMLLYDGYDWPRTRRTIEEQVTQMRKRLAKIKHLVANGQVQEPIEEDTGALLFNSVYIGLPEDVDTAEPEALIAAIDEELRDDFETGTQSSWQSLKHPPSQPRQPSVRLHGKKLARSKGPSIEFCLQGLNAEFNQCGGDNVLVSRTFVTVRDLEILDHIKTSTWKKFLTPLRSDSKGNVRETGANMVRIELHNVRPAPGHPSQEARLRAKILPIRLYVDQDAVDFLKKFFSFQDPDAAPATPDSKGDGDAYIQMAEIFPIDLKLDYKPRRVDYRALKEGRTIELMNFFHFDGAEMTLRHITLAGITGWPKVFEMLNDLWTPDVKATQLVDVISGVAPIRSMVNVGSGVADLVLLPISQYKKDGRIVRGVQKGATAFVKSTAIEAIKMGARLATGTQVILEQAEGLLGSDFDKTITTETFSGFDDEFEGSPDEELDPISKYSQQPADITEGVQTAYKSLRRNLGSAAQTILAVPMEVYERSGNEGPVRSVIRAVPIAVLKPMIGASEAVSKTLLGLHNTLDPNVRIENEAKYK